MPAPPWPLWGNSCHEVKSLNIPTCKTLHGASPSIWIHVPCRGGGCWSTFRSSKILGNIGCCGNVKAARYFDFSRCRTACCGMMTLHVPDRPPQPGTLAWLGATSQKFAPKQTILRQNVVFCVKYINFVQKCVVVHKNLVCAKR